MHETEDDFRELQRLLDESYDRAGEHLRSIFPPERRLSARDLSRLLPGVFLLDLATVTASGEPIVAPVDGLFYRGRIWFGLPPGSLRGRHLRNRPQVSATHTSGDDLCLIVHGVAREVTESDPEHAGFTDYSRRVYGPIYDLSVAHYRDRKGSGFNAWIRPRRIFAARTVAQVQSSLR